MAAAEQDGPHLRGRGRRGHAGGVLRRHTPLSALLPDYWTWRTTTVDKSVGNTQPDEFFFCFCFCFFCFFFVFFF